MGCSTLNGRSIIYAVIVLLVLAFMSVARGSVEGTNRELETILYSQGEENSYVINVLTSVVSEIFRDHEGYSLTLKNQPQLKHIVVNGENIVVVGELMESNVDGSLMQRKGLDVYSFDGELLEVVSNYLQPEMSFTAQLSPEGIISVDKSMQFSMMEPVRMDMSGYKQINRLPGARLYFPDDLAQDAMRGYR
jgi:hypothetical protein